MSKRNIKRQSVAALAAAVGLVCASSAWSQVTSTPEVIWDGGGTPGATGSYVAAANWNPDTTPVNTSSQFLEINDGGTAQVTTGDAAQGAFLALGLRPGDVGHLTIDGGDLFVGEMRVGGRETINSNLADWTTGTFNPNAGGTGSVLQTGGTVRVTYRDASNTEPPIQSLYIGDAGTASNTANGSYTISGGSLFSGVANNDAIVIGTGPGTLGTFVQSGTSTVTSTGSVTVARGGATASYTMNGGTLNVGDGAFSANMTFRIGDGEYPTGISTATSGTFTQSAGTVTAQGDVSVGRSLGTGTYTITGNGTALNANNTIEVGRGSTGTMTQGTDGAGATGPLVKVGVINSGTQGLSVGRSFTAGIVSDGTYNLLSGTLQIGNAANDYLAIGDGVEGYGKFNMKAGTTLTSTDLIQMGRQNSDKDNRFNMDGGSVSASRIIVGGGNTSGKGTWTMKGGTVSHSSALNIAQGSAATGTLDIQGGTWTLTGTTGTNGVVAVGNGAGSTGTLTISGGTLSAETSAGVVDVGRGSATGSLTLSGTGNLKTTLLRAPTRTAGSATILFKDTSQSTITTLTLDNGTMTINGGTHNITTANVNAAGALNVNITMAIPTVTVAGGVVTLGEGANNVLRANALTISSGKVDVKTDKLITQVPAGTWNGSTYTGVSGLVKAGRGSGAWDGATGIITSMTAAGSANPVTTVAVADNAVLGKTTFGGVPVTAADTLVMYTYNGDANLSGKVDADDYFIIDSNYNKSGTVFGFVAGDFNYDGVINGDDYFQIDTGFAGQGAPIGAAAGVGGLSGVSAVPEPAGLTILALAGVGALRRRRRGQ